MSVIILMILGWIALTGALAHLNLLSDFSRNNPAIGWLILIALGVSTAVAVSPLCSAFVRTAPIAWLIGFQSFRIIVEVLLHRGYLAGIVPVQMTWSGRNFDILTGLTAIPLAILAARGQLPRWAAITWNLVGFALLINIMTVSILSTPTVFRMFPNEPANTFIAQFPYIWLPTVLVPAAWVGHLLLFRRLQG
jgi:hypothetical protein